MKVMYNYVPSNNLTPNKIYEVIGENEKGNCYVIRSTDKGKVGVFKKHKFTVITNEQRRG